MVIARTPPVRIASPSPARGVDARRSVDVPNLEVKPDFNILSKNGAKKRRKKQGMKPAAPAATIIKGFQTPIASAGEESDLSAADTPRFGPRNLSSISNSPGMRAASPCGGISALKLKLEALSLENALQRPSTTLSADELKPDVSSASSVTSEMTSGSDKTEMESYQVNLENDFVSPDVRSTSVSSTIEDSPHHDALTRKMSATDFEPISCLGKGTYGTVLLVKQKATGRLFAQKQLRKASLTVHKKLVEQTKTERSILESVNRHPFVVKLYYAFQDHEKLYLILEYAQGGELFHHLAMERMFTEEVAAFYMAEMVLALEHLHRNVGVVYRDLKPENCLLDSEGHLLLTDFGLSKVAVDADDCCRSILGTIEYMAPEVIQGVEYGMAVDWWSLGALGFDLLTGSPPFTANNHAKTQEKILKQKLVLPYFLGPDAKDLLTRLLRKEPRKRLGYSMPKDLQTIKSHRFFRKVDWKRLERREVEPPIRPLITDPELAENFAREFTDLAVSPVAERRRSEMFLREVGSNPFGGFSFVASRSLLECGDWGV